jgi:hypothetical protein
LLVVLTAGLTQVSGLDDSGCAISVWSIGWSGVGSRSIGSMSIGRGGIGEWSSTDYTRVGSGVCEGRSISHRGHCGSQKSWCR